jgi:hypothetical protein
MRRAFFQPRLAGVGVVLGFLVYLLPLYGVIPRPGPGGASDRALGIVFARHRQAHQDVVADDRPVPRPLAPAVLPACPLAVTAPEPGRCSMGGDARRDRASRPPSPGSPRSPPIL